MEGRRRGGDERKMEGRGWKEEGGEGMEGRGMGGEGMKEMHAHGKLADLGQSDNTAAGPLQSVILIHSQGK